MRLVIILLLAATSALGGAVAPNNAMLAEVRSGKRTEANASWWGYDPADATKSLQAAIDSGAKKLIVLNLGTPWIVEGIRLASNQHIVFEKGAVVLAKRGSFKGRGDALFIASQKKNIALEGYGATLKMWKSDYQTDAYEKAEWRHCLSIRSCANVKVLGLTLAESGGDGIYLGVSKRGVTNSSVHIRDVVCDANHRQGISVISAEDLLIENTVMRNTSGTAPQAGIDFEPNHASEKLVRCVMRNCVTENNAGSGYLFALHHMTGASAPVSIRLENCRATGDHRQALRWHCCGSHPDGPTHGQAEFVNCTLERSGLEGIALSNVVAKSLALCFKGCKVLDVAARMPNLSPITFGSRPENHEPIGNIALENCLIRDSLDRTPIAWGGWTTKLQRDTVRGAITVERSGRTSRYTLDSDTLRKWLPWTAVQDIPPFDLSGVRFGPLRPRPQGDYPLNRWRLRGASEYVVFAEAGRGLTFSVQARAVGSSKGPVAMKLVTPSGRTVKLPSPPVGQDKQYDLAAEETGAYRLVCDPGRATVTVGSRTHRVCIVAGATPMHGFGARGTFHFLVPAGTARFGIKISGSGSGERLKATVCDPLGNAVQAKDSIAGMHGFAVARDDASKDAVWSLRIERPSLGTLEDWYVELLGVPPLLAASPDALLKPVAK
jgi:hypothetical protein